MKKTAEEILKQHANCELKMILEDDLHWLTEAMHQYATQEVAEASKMKEFEINFDGHVKCVIEIEGGKLNVTKAMNGWGDSIPTDSITIEPLPIPPQPKEKEETR